MTFDPAALRDPGRRWRWLQSDRVVDVLVWSSPPVALLVGVMSLAASAPDNIGPFGLVQALRPELYVCLALLTASFVTVLFVRRSAPGILLAAHVVVLAVLLHGAATILEPLPRFPSAWLHVGFADYIARTGRTLPELDARMSWPGFFALAAMVTRAGGLQDAMPLLGWTPVVFNLLYGVAVYLIARNTTSDRRATWLAVWLFYPANWVGQDYFAPQGLDYLFYLILLVVLLMWFRPSRLERERSSRNPRWPRLRRVVVSLQQIARLPPRPMQHEPPDLQLLPRQRVALMVALIAIFVASTVSHQLTPTTMIASVALLVIVDRCTVRQLPLLLAVILAGYVSYLTVAYWSGHLADMFGSLGHIGTTVSSGTTERVRGDAAHQLVSRARLLLTFVVWCVAGAGAWRRLRRGTADLALLALTAAPFLVILLQSYGSEVLLRVYMFVLPAAVVLLAGVLLPAHGSRRLGSTAAMAGLLTVVLIGAFYVTRYGNENFERVRPADVDAVNWVYGRAVPGSSLVAITSNVPWRFQRIEQYEYTPLSNDLGPQELSTIEGEMATNPHGAFLIISKGQDVYAESYLGRPRGWGERLERQILRSQHFRLVYRNAEAKVFVLATHRKEE
jgi:hypothetical protein